MNTKRNIRSLLNKASVVLAESHGYSNDYDVWVMFETNRGNGAKWQTSIRKAHEQAITQ